MVIKQDELTKILKKYIRKIKTCFDVEAVYLYGSYANGKAKPHSDIDIAVVSSDFKYMADEIAMQILSRLARNIELKIEAVPLEPDQVNKPLMGTLSWEVVHSGRKLF